MSKPRPVYLKIGKLGRSTGKSGEIRMIAEQGISGDFTKLKHVFLGFEGQKVPYFPNYLKNDGEIIVKFDDVQGPEEANHLANVEVFISAEQANQFNFNKSKASEDLTRYSIADQDDFIRGSIIRMVEYPHQIIAVVDTGAGEKMVPMVEHWIQDIDPEERVIFMDLPEGLFDEEE